MNRCFAIALSILPLTCGALAEPISVTEISVVDGDTVAAHGHTTKPTGDENDKVDFGHCLGVSYDRSIGTVFRDGIKPEQSPSAGSCDELGYLRRASPADQSQYHYA